MPEVIIPVENDEVQVFVNALSALKTNAAANATVVKHVTSPYILTQGDNSSILVFNDVDAVINIPIELSVLFNFKVVNIGTGGVTVFSASGESIKGSNVLGDIDGIMSVIKLKSNIWQSSERGVSGTKSLYLWLQNGQSLSKWSTDVGNVIPSSPTLSDTYLYNGISATSANSTVKSTSDVESLIPYAATGDVADLGLSGLKVLKEDFNDGGSWLFGAAGKGGASLADLSDPSVMYDNAMLQINALSGRATDLSLTPKFPFVMWVQGVSDAEGDLDDYQVRLRAYQDDYIAKATIATGQTELPFIIGVTGSSHGMAKAQYNYIRTHDDAIMSTPKYFLNTLFPNTGADSVHLNPNGYIIQEEYKGIAAAKLMNTGVSKGLEPISFTVVGNTIEILMDVPTLPILTTNQDAGVFDNYGIEWINSLGNKSSDGMSVTISADKIIVDIGQSATVGSTIEFCGEGGSNITDSTVRASACGVWNLAHWLPNLDYVMSSGDGAVSGNGNLWIYSGYTFDGSESGAVVVGTTVYAGLAVRSYRVRANVVSAGTGDYARIKVGDRYVNIQNTEAIDTTISVTSIAIPRMSLVGFTGFIGSVSDISVTEV
jgi:hypothetical protein